MSNKFLFIVAPILAFAPALAAWAVIPFDEGCGVGEYQCGLTYFSCHDLYGCLWDYYCRLGF